MRRKGAPLHIYGGPFSVPRHTRESWPQSEGARLMLWRFLEDFGALIPTLERPQPLRPLRRYPRFITPSIFAPPAAYLRRRLSRYETVVVRGKFDGGTRQLEADICHPLRALFRTRTDTQRRPSGCACIVNPVNDSERATGPEHSKDFAQ